MFFRDIPKYQKIHTVADSIAYSKTNLLECGPSGSFNFKGSNIRTVLAHKFSPLFSIYHLVKHFQPIKILI